MDDSRFLPWARVVIKTGPISRPTSKLRWAVPLSNTGVTPGASLPPKGSIALWRVYRTHYAKNPSRRQPPNSSSHTTTISQCRRTGGQREPLWR